MGTASDATGVGATGTSFEWKPEYDALLNHIATTNLFESDWSHLKAILKCKITANIDQMLSDTSAPRPPTPQRPQTPPSSGSTAVVGPPTPPLTLKGLILPPFPPRNPLDEHIIKALPANMSHTDAHGSKNQVFSMLDEFEKPPFTIQRLCELAIRPREHYSLVGKYLRAFERTLLVTSTWDEYISYTLPRNSRGASSSPPPLALDNHRGSGDSGDENTPPRGMSMAKIRTLKVDELDDLDDVEAFSRGGRRGHLAEHPEASSASGTTGIGNLGASGSGSPTSMRALNGSLAGDISPPPLSDRFVRSSTPEPSPTRAREENKREAAAAAASSEGSPSSLIEEGELEDVIMSPF
ncbi:hypothetical protein BS47DRAFT_1379247 [Hydnum rufescens UP504]|uniref:PPP4R2-domain-containing protein n=1 Tax=Hydnum rufescens UP504 TaxID=1448309 RepID=A0A9P6B8K5_9AGAM|nr:hypothetical protein BS47DRAFT_1379247 [Hydnum rufescens UP504]